MRRGFIFNYDLCVACRACSAACMLENRWKLNARRILVHNKERYTSEPVINVSMACNHCLEPLCMTGCPTAAYRKDEFTGAILLDEKRCIGCRYCKWNCPFGAPRYTETKGIVEKCHFCNDLIREGHTPACARSCPTGALEFGNIPDHTDNAEFEFIPEKNINPSLVIRGNSGARGPEVIPQPEEVVEPDSRDKISVLASSSWSLLLFSFLATLSASVTLSSFITNRSDGYLFSLVSITLSLLVTFFHLGSKLKAWMSIRNWKSSPLSREILGLLLYFALLSMRPYLDIRPFHIILSLSALALLLLIDSVYVRSGGEQTRYHSGQVFITSLLIVSFLSRQIVPFVLIASVKLLIIIVTGKLTGRERTFFSLRFFRIALLLISGFILISGTGIDESTSMVIFMTGEFSDRVLFYFDFAPLNIKNTIKKPLNVK